jgi:hypothetical protein
VACAKPDEAATTDSAGGTVDSAGVIAPAAFRVSDVELGKRVDAENKLADQTDDFGVRDTIIAAVKTEGTASGATLMARWTYQDGQVVEEQSQTINATGDMTTNFRLTKATAWPKGNYKLTVLLNGAEVETEDFEIK